MRKIHLASLVLAALFVVAMTENSQAQRPAHYYPARPVFSNYLLYRQFNGTGIPNYYAYVKPAEQFRDFVSRSRERPTGGRQQLVAIEQEVAKVLTSQLRQRTTTGIGQPAVSATFGDTSHFYPRPGARR